MQIIQIIQIRNLPALKDLDNDVGIYHTDDLAEVPNFSFLGPMSKTAAIEGS